MLKFAQFKHYPLDEAGLHKNVRTSPGWEGLTPLCMPVPLC